MTSWTLRIAVTIAVVGATLLRLLLWSGRDKTLASLDCGSNRRLEVQLSASAWDGPDFPAVRWQVFESNVAQLRCDGEPRHYGIGYLNETGKEKDLRFDIIFSNDRSIVGLFEQHQPNELLAIYDLTARLHGPTIGARQCWKTKSKQPKCCQLYRPQTSIGL